MKKIFYLIIVVSLSLSFIASTCTPEETVTPPTSNPYSAIKLYTEDAGLTWEVHELRSYDNISGISSFSNELSSFSIIADSIGPYRYRIIKTTDFGTTWPFSYALSGSQALNDITRTSVEGKGFIVAGSGTVIITTDYGSTWHQSSSLNDINLLAIDFGDEMNGIIIPVNPGDNIYITTNGGLNWTAGNPIPTNNYINAIGFINSTTAVVCGHNGEIFRTTDIGNNWAQVTSPTNQDLNGIDFNDPVGIIVGNSGTILRTTDSGLSWITGSVSSSANLQKIYISDLGYWACGDNVIISSYNIGNTWGIRRNVSNEYYNDLLFIKSAGFVVGARR